MSYITVTEEQAELILSGNQTIEVRDAGGRVLGHIPPPIPPEEIALAKASKLSNGPRYSFDQVLAHLRSLESQ
ncbi:MAG: hypothetical protein B7Z73_01365 [Planctomycetia bacterium 21-64-5]|nr:MAG: hypothetical protein B7Z73_01365 [Planctomycetia bacterium 21-64-5]HQU42945.1 hypothetical protein [Pirellulales bacterium]